MNTAVHGSKQINAPDRKLETLPVSLSKRDLEEWSNGSYMRHDFIAWRAGHKMSNNRLNKKVTVLTIAGNLANWTLVLQ